MCLWAKQIFRSLQRIRLHWYHHCRYLTPDFGDGDIWPKSVMNNLRYCVVVYIPWSLSIYMKGVKCTRWPYWFLKAQVFNCQIDELKFNWILNSTFKVIRKFFLNHHKSFRWHLGDYEKHNFFSIWRPVREEPLIFVCFYGCLLCPLKTGLYKLNGGSGRRHARRGPRARRAEYPPVKTNKNQSFSSHKPSNGKKNMFFVIPEMPYKTFVMV